MRQLLLKIAFAAVAILLRTAIGFACTCAPNRLVPELPPDSSVDLNWIGLSGYAIQQQSTDTYVAFTLKPQKHVSIELGFKPKEGKWFSPPK